MATLADAKEELRIAKMILQIAKENDYRKVIVYLEQNVLKAQKAVDEFNQSPLSNMLNGFFDIVAPRSPKGPVLPFTTDQCTTPTFRGVIVQGPHYV
jgi:hypothetical protein